MSTHCPVRIKIAACILTGVFAVSVLSFCCVQMQCRDLRAKTDTVTALLEADAEKTEVEQAITALTTKWESDLRTLGLMLPGDILSDLNEAICRLPALIDDPDDLEAELLSVSANLRRICRQETVVL